MFLGYDYMFKYYIIVYSKISWGGSYGDGKKICVRLVHAGRP